MESVLLQMTSLLGEQRIGVTAISETFSSSSVLVKQHALFKIHLQQLHIDLLHNNIASFYSMIIILLVFPFIFKFGNLSEV